MDKEKHSDEVFDEIPEFFDEKNMFGISSPKYKKAKSRKLFNNLSETEVIGEYQYASLFSRIIAYLIDCTIIGIITAFILALMSDGTIPEFDLSANLLLLVLTTLYYGNAESSSRQATIGKRLLGIKVVDLKGEKISFATACFRYICIFLSLLPFGAGIFAITSNKHKQAWHDSITDCLVIKK